jgi:hypothetical protein
MASIVLGASIASAAAAALIRLAGTWRRRVSRQWDADVAV